MRLKARESSPQVAGCHHRLPEASRSVALTFDDGPDPQFTPLVLDVLAEHGVHATFFLVGFRAERHPEVVRRIQDEGHAIGSHTQTHPDLWEVPLTQAIQEFRRGRATLESITGSSLPLFRPPKGSLNLSQAASVRALQLHTWLWSVDPGDWKPETTPDAIMEGLGQLQPGDVVLLHDAIEKPIEASTTDRSATVGALSRIILAARSQGLGFATLS
jgi:peptidoglycan/xylan/chitin deacetylase (PgdA/CDA1 family)